MSKLELQTRGMGISMTGQPHRFLLARERVACFTIPILERDTLPVTKWTPYAQMYYSSDLLLRYYVEDPGYDSFVQFDAKFEQRNFGTTGTAPNEVPNEATEDYIRAVPITVQTQVGEPKPWEMPSANESTGRNFTHLSLGVTVDVWDMTFDHNIICEVWAVAWRNYRGTVPGTMGAKGSSAPRWAVTDIRVDLKTARKQLEA